MILLYAVVISIIICLITLLGLLTKVAPLIEVAIGNNNYYRGEYGQAIVNYIHVLGQDELDPFIHYNLGNVYKALGETEAAMDTLKLALKGTDTELAFRTHFNLGNIYYELGDYKNAGFHFRESL